jgi:hypothetical protein
MADWFSDVVAQVSDEVVASPATASRLGLTDRVTLEDLKTGAVNAEDELRTQFADNVRAIQEIRDSIQRAERDALAREWQAVLNAEQRLSQANAGQTLKRSIFERFRRWFMRTRRSDSPGDVAEEASQAVDNARQAYEAARVNKKVDQLEPIRRLEADRTQRLSLLHDLVYPALILRVNQVIDDVLDASYERTFSYAGKAILTDPLEVSVQPVNTDAYQEIKYLIDKVGSGTIGVAGPRGSGKSTLLSRFAVTVKIDDEPRQWGVCVPAPAKYDARDFLLYLFAQLCLQVLGSERARAVESRLTSTRPSARTVLPLLRVLILAGAAALACFGIVIGLRTAHLRESPMRTADLAIASCSALVCLIAVVDFFMRYIMSFLRFSIPVYRRMNHDSWGMNQRVDPYARRLTVDLTLLTAVLSGLTAAALFGLFLAGGTLDPGYLAAGGLGIASFVALFILLRGYLPQPSGLRPVYDINGSDGSFDPSLAEDWYARVKFQQSFTTGWSGTITVGAPSLPVQAQGGSSGSTAITPVAMSTPEIVGAIKSFTQAIASQRREVDKPEVRIPVVIGIDEVDKIEDPQEAQAFLNQVKGLFGDSSCLFLVSISDDAMAAFERRGMPFRDAFDSSLSSVVTLSYLSRKEARTLTGSRLLGVQEPVADLLFVLAGGLARDLVRLIRRAVEAGEAGRAQLDGLARAMIAADVDTKKRAVLARARTLESCSAKDDLLAWAGRHDGKASDAGRDRASDARTYYAGLLADAVSMIGSACDGSAHQPPAGDKAVASASCAGREIGVFGFWLATVGQVFLSCADREAFLAGEAAEGDKSFDRLAEARQNFPLGPEYVLAATKRVRTAWKLADGAPADKPLAVVPLVAQKSQVLVDGQGHGGT